MLVDRESRTSRLCRKALGGKIPFGLASKFESLCFGRRGKAGERRLARSPPL